MERMLLTALLLVKLYVAIGQGVMNPCYFWPGSVYAGDGACYRLFTNKINYNRSLYDCESQGAHLAEPRTQRQRDTIKSMMQNYLKVWLGGYYTNPPTTFEWLSNITGYKDPSWKWLYSRCLAMESTTKMVQYKCGKTLTRMCEIYAGNPCDVYLPGAEYRDNNCFLPVNQPMNLEGAAAHCEERNAKVIEPSTDSLKSHSAQLATWNFGPENTIWLGVTQRNDALVWRSTGDMLSQTMTWTLGTSTDSSVVMNGTRSWSWEVVPETSLAQVICQRDISYECTGVFTSGRCLNFYHGAGTWTGAKASCEEKGSYLVEPITELLHRTIIRYRADKKATVVYLGATDAEMEGEFKWDFSNQPLSETFTSWTANQPDGGKNEDYLEFGRLNVNSWRAVSNGDTSREQHSYICETYIPIYVHSYVVVFPQTRWDDATSLTRALLSLVSFPHQKRPNFVQIITYPTGEVKSFTLTRSQVFQYNIVVTGFWKYRSGMQEEYLRVKSTYPLDVHFLIWRPRLEYHCSSLVLDEMTQAQGHSKTFFIPPWPKSSQLAIVSTENGESTENVAVSSGSETFTLSLNSGNMALASTTLKKQYHSLVVVDSIAGTSSSQVVHSTGALNVFRFTQECGTSMMNTSCEQIRPISMIGRDYITFPSLPMSYDVTDHFTMVAVYNGTIVKVYDPKSGANLQTITLQWPGDVYELALPAYHFYHVNGTAPFYLSLKLTGPGGIRSLTLLDASLYRASYQLAIAGPLTAMAECFLVAIVDTEHKQGISVVDGNSRTLQRRDTCQNVYGTSWSGCYFQLAKPRPGQVYTVEMTSGTLSTFGAYLFCTRNNRGDTLSYPLGMATAKTEDVDYDFDEYLQMAELKHSCTEETTTPVIESAATTEMTTEAAETTYQPTTEYPTTEQPTTEYPTTEQPTTEAPTTMATTEMISTAQDYAWMSSSTPTSPKAAHDANQSLARMNSTSFGPLSCAEIVVSRVNITLTIEEVEESKEKIIAHLSVKHETLSSVKRSKISVPDDRISSTTMGMGGIVFIGFVLGLVVVLDFNKLVHDLGLAFKSGFGV